MANGATADAERFCRRPPALSSYGCSPARDWEASLLHPARTSDAWVKKSVGMACRNRHVMPMGRSPSWET